MLNIETATDVPKLTLYLRIFNAVVDGRLPAAVKVPLRATSERDGKLVAQNRREDRT